jgi:F0F1-type ATP synthase assembly protein I
VEELVLSRSASSGILRRAFFTVRSDDTTPTAGRPTASGATAGFTLLAALLVCVGIGLGIGWAAGSAAVGGAVGAVIGIPASFYLVYRTYRDL